MNFDEWWESAPHRAKYPKEHPAYLAAREAWAAAVGEAENVVSKNFDPGEPWLEPGELTRELL